MGVPAAAVPPSLSDPVRELFVSDEKPSDKTRVDLLPLGNLPVLPFQKVAAKISEGHEMETFFPIAINRIKPLF